ncbi:MAG: hypothetical protein COA78_28440 [Blastopirellula sp.]|nr:MAG: hypothetical protein COA78_28440 [Blastopirellula sp.]
MAKNLQRQAEQAVDKMLKPHIKKFRHDVEAVLPAIHAYDTTLRPALIKLVSDYIQADQANIDSPRVHEMSRKIELLEAENKRLHSAVSKIRIITADPI